jgi:hypothetical protein
MTYAIFLPYPNPIVQRAWTVVSTEVLLLVRAVWTQIVDRPHTFGLCLLHLQLLLTNKILLKILGWL